jgi:hypothetical protein
MQNCNYIHRFLVCVNIWAPIVYLGREICVRLPLLTICWLGLILLFYQINSWVLAEVDNFEKACETISSHTYPHFFNHVCFVSELYYFDLSRFPTLIAVAQELKKGDTSSSSSSVSNTEVILTAGADPITVKALVNLHRSSSC